MQTFKIKASSWVIYSITFFTIIVAGSILFKKLLPSHNVYLTFLSFTFLLAISVLFVRKFGIAKTIWKISDKEIHLTWITQFIFHKRPNLTISWDDIHGYNIRHERSFDRFKLFLKNGTIIRLWHDNLITKDDFEKFINYFLNKVEAHNNEELKKINSEKK